MSEQKNCEDCGGLHYGSIVCPYLQSDPGGHLAARNPAKQPQPSEHSTPGERQEESSVHLCGAVHPRESHIYCDKGRNHHGYHASSKDEVRVWPDPQPFPVGTVFTGQHSIVPSAAKPVDDLGELERLARDLGDEWYCVSEAWPGLHPRTAAFIAFCSPNRIQSLIHRAREAEAWNAEWTAVNEAARERLLARAEAAEQSLQAEREKTARLQAVIDHLG